MEEFVWIQVYLPPPPFESTTLMPAALMAKSSTNHGARVCCLRLSMRFQRLTCLAFDICDRMHVYVTSLGGTPYERMS